MSENTSLTDAVKLTAGVSLTRAVKEAAGRTAWLVDEVVGSRESSIQGALARQAQQFLAACGRLAPFAVLILPFLYITPLSPVLDAVRESQAATHRRVALVIGNSAYRHTPRLENPKNDAADMSAALRKLGFRVIEGFDLDKKTFDAKVRDFATALEGSDVGLFFYAGHGMQVSGDNYLVPVNAKLTTISALEIEMVRLDIVHRTMEQKAQTSLLFFDACRNNPLVRNLARAMGPQSLDIAQGLAAVDSSAGTLISFSTQPGNVALDGKGRNSPFSGALVAQLATSNEDINAILIAVRNEVMQQTDRKQVPWEHSALTRRFYFNAAVQAAAFAPTTQLRLREAAEAWSETKDNANFALLDAFVARYSDTFFAELARARIDELRKGMLHPPAPEAETTSAFSR
jgi:uncharacterized caspase-like protein